MKQTLFFVILLWFAKETCSQTATTAVTAKSISERNLLYLNAANFDFGGTTKTSYVGHLNIFSPSPNHYGWGINTGIFKINYNQEDSLTNYTKIENVIINPLQSLSSGDKYLKQINTYSIKNKNSSWSYYVQPVITLIPDRVYAHAHAELYVNKYSVSTSINTISQDTATLPDPIPNNTVLRARLLGDSVRNVSYVNGYFGVGFTFTLEPWANGYLFIQPTVGFTTDSPGQRSILKYPSGSHFDDKSWNSFYLIRSYYAHKLTNSTILVGVDIRGLFPRFNPQYGAYIGLNLKIDSIVSAL